MRLTLDLWHPDCWTLEVTDAVDAGLLGHGVYTVDGQANGRFTAYADTTLGVDDLVAAIEASPLTDTVWEVDESGVVDDTIPGNASRRLVVRYDLSKSINDALVSRGFIPDEPVRMVDGREHWTVIADCTRETALDRLADIEAELHADIELRRVTATERSGTGVLPLDSLSERQREVFELARERGYYAWPRDVSAADLAGELDVSKATLLEHLRKAEAKLLGRPRE